MAEMRQVGRDIKLPIAVIDEILRYIHSNHLRPGDKLPREEELCQALRVSRTALREATRALADRGLLTAIPGRGTFLSSPGSSVVSRAMSSLLLLQECSLWELNELRRLLEVHLCGIAALQRDSGQLSEIASAFQRLEGHLTPELALEADRDFHVAVAVASSNRLGATLVDAMMGAMVEMRRRSFAIDKHFVQMHKGLYDAILAGDANTARQAMDHHFDLVRELLGTLEADEDKVGLSG
jgi:DNA-binding FadR family transcriptional regulator